MNAPAINAAFASQAAFRALMEATAQPGEIRTASVLGAPAPLSPAAAALVQSLTDYETPVWLDAAFARVPAVAEWIRFQTGAPIVSEPKQAAFALIADVEAIPDVTQFALGNEEYPDRSTTVIAQIERFGGRAFQLGGPGIKTSRTFAAEPLPNDFVQRMAANRELFPRGVDLVLVAGEMLAALPRSVRITEGF